MQRLFLIGFLIFTGLFTGRFSIYSQTNLFASIQGTTSLDTANWHFNGDAALGDTGGDSDSYPNEVVLTPNQADKFGQVFFKTPVNLATCTKWKVEFEMRMYDGSGADGIVFCAINELPTSYFGGGSMGIPVTSHGLKVCFDSYDNYVSGVQCGGNNPEIQVAYGTGYSECDNTMTRRTNNTSIWATNMNYLTDKDYDKVTITYDNGAVQVVTSSGSTNPLHTNQTLNATITPLNGAVYFGFTASTGMLYQTHSIRNVKIYADVPATNNAGLDQAVCSGQTVQLGTATTANHTYLWNPATDLSSAAISNPTATLSNTGTVPVNYTYTVRTERNNAASCYMVDTVTITVNPGPSITENVSFCQGSSVTVRGNTITTDGAHTFFIPAVSGCDTTLTVNASYLSAPSSTANVTICSGDTYSFNGTNYSTAGTYSHTITMPTGCDSVATLVLTVSPPLTGTESREICPGSSFTYHGQTYSSAGTFNVNLQNAQGCDSIVTLTVTLSSLLRDTTFASVCPGGSYSFNGTTYTTAGNYDVNLSTAQGCDSVQTLVLTYSNAVNTYDTLEKCQNETITYQGQNISSAGNYSFTFTAASGCDSILNLTVIDRPVVTTTLTSTLCQGEKITYNNQDYTTTGTYTINVAAPNGCDSIIILDLVVYDRPAKPLVTTNLPLACYGEEFAGEVANAAVSNDYYWYLDTNSVAYHSGIKSAYVIDEHTQNIYVQADNGTCKSAFEVIPVVVSQLFNDTFEMPNVITPNADGLNDKIDFEAIFGGCVEYEVLIFNRWGNLVFNQKSGSSSAFEGKDMNGEGLTDGTYFYKINYESGERQGFVMIVRK